MCRVCVGFRVYSQQCARQRRESALFLCDVFPSFFRRFCDVFPSFSVVFVMVFRRFSVVFVMFSRRFCDVFVMFL
jgi:hypothetical protein